MLGRAEWRERYRRAGESRVWWHNAVIYEIYVRSFADSDGDGLGDLRGVIGRLDYLQWLGVDAIWCTPITVSPGRDNGYDVADYLAVDPVLGTMDDVDRLVAEAGRRGIRVLLDLVPNHTSIEHPWFRDERTRRAYYVWADEPNNWISSFQIPSWTYHAGERRYYMHSYLPEQPDLDWWNEDVRAEFDCILRHWFDRGVAGFRIDACYILVKDRYLRDNPPVTALDHRWDINRGQRPVWNAHQPEVHDVLRRWRSVADEYDPPRLLMGATWVPDPERLAAYYGDDDELQLPQNFEFLFADFDAAPLRAVAEPWLAAVPEGRVPVWVGSTHDLSRFPSRWCDGDPALVRTALTMLTALPGACVLYQGDEIGLQDTVLPAGWCPDPMAPCREAYRTPMPWDDSPGGGFTTGTPWLPLGDVIAANVAAQLADPSSTLHHARRAIAAKKRLAGPYAALDGPSGHWVFRRGETVVDLDFTARGALVGDPRPVDAGALA